MSTLLARWYGMKGWTAIGVFIVVLCAVMPLANLVATPGSTWHVSDYFVTLAGKIMCYAIVAIALDLVWGYAGILSLGHGLFFALGGYAMGMYLMRQIGSRPGRSATYRPLPQLVGPPSSRSPPSRPRLRQRHCSPWLPQSPLRPRW